MDNEYVQLGYIKAKFPLTARVSLSEAPFMGFCRQFASMRVTGHFVYVTLGHDDIPDNHIGRELLTEIATLRGKVTRLDFCLDVQHAFDIGAYYWTMKKLYENKDIKRRLGLPSLLASPVGITCYVGKRSSARMLRVYDKRKEILHRKKVDIGFELTRFEIEIKREQVPRYRTLFMSGHTQSIVDDIAERYLLPWLASSPNKVKPFHIPVKHDGEMAFIYRFKSVIKRAYATDRKQFLEIISEEL